MNERFGVVRGLSPGDAYSRYGLLFFGSYRPSRLIER